MNPLDFLSSLNGCIHQITLAYGLPLSLLLAGLVGSMTHCVVMCGPFVVSQTGNMKKIQDAALIPYHLGRMTTYVFMAIMAHSVFSLIFVYSDLKSIIAIPMLLLAGTIFLVSAFPQLISLFPWAHQIKLTLPLPFIYKLSSKISQNSNGFSRYILGVLLGFMPCGLVIAALLASSTAGTLWEAMIAMIAFTIGTIPALILVAISGGSLKQKYPKFSLRFSQIAKTLSALWLFTLAGTLIL